MLKQREIKFRVWDVGKMFYTVTVGQNPAVLDGGGEWAECTESCVVMQYTGLKDKNGKDVYQNDLIKITADKENYGSTSYGGIALIVPQICGYDIKPIKPSLEELDEEWRNGGDGWDSTSMWHIDNPDNVEVIGNIYENPELLERVGDE
jgi:uncharacterized phage protein (TIGR01671 family)